MTDTFLVTMDSIACYKAGCGIVFAVPREWLQAAKRTHSTFYCPNGHSQQYASMSDVERAERDTQAARDALARERAWHDQTKAERDHIERRRSAIAAAKTRLVNRIKSGVCPLCNRHFDALRRHMQSKHGPTP